jgi:hypothetical protein
MLAGGNLDYNATFYYLCQNFFCQTQVVKDAFMKNIVGQTPRGEDFYPRIKIIEKIYRRLEGGNNLYLSAPRRAGKTSIMMALEDAPRAGYVFAYLNVEDCLDSENYFRLLSETLERSAITGKFERLGEKAKGMLAGFFERIKKIRISVFEIETNQPAREEITFATAFERLLQDLDDESITIVVMVDEFPVAIENIAKLHGIKAAVQFLHANRGMRQRAGKGIRFIYTGSIGLPNVARKLDPAPTINDLNIVEIPPLTTEEGIDMSKQIFKSYEIEAEEQVIRYMLSEIQWLMPFFIQLVIQLLIDEYESDGTPIVQETVDKVLLKAANHRNNIYFASYYDRLDKTLPADQCTIAKSILAVIAEKDEAPLHHFRACSNFDSEAKLQKFYF